MRVSGFSIAWRAGEREGWRLPAWRVGSWLQRLNDFARGREELVLGDARIIDKNLSAERLRSGERFAELFRWSFIILFLLLDIVQPAGGRQGQVLVYGLLMLWAAVNSVVTVMLFRGYSPNRWFCYATSGVDIVLASALIGVTGGLSSPFYLAFFLVIISGAMRFGVLAALFSSLLIVLLYLVVGGYTSNLMQNPARAEDVIGKVGIFILVGGMTGLMSQELIRERQVAIGRAEEKDALQKMSNELTSTIKLEEILLVVLRHALRIVGGADGRILVVNPDNGEVRAYGAAGEQVLVFENLDLSQEKSKAKLLEKGRRMLVPIVAPHADDVFLLDLRGKHSFGNRQFDMVSQLAINASGPLNNSLRYLSKEAEATTDSLTGLVNQREMRRLMGVMIKRQKDGRNEPFSLMMIDIDYFKQVNDTKGHEYGNEVLTGVARLIGKTMRSHDIVVRYGGDEMAVILVGAGVAEADLASERMVKAIRNASIKGAGDSYVSLSIGTATCPEHADSVERLIEAADQGLYLVKQAGRNGAKRLPTKAERDAAAGQP